VLVEGRGRHGRAGLGRPGRQVVEDLDLERLPGLGLERPALRERHLAPDERVVGGDALAHARLDRLQVGRGQRPGQVEVVIEAVLDRRADAQPGAREQVEHASAITCAALWRIASMGACAPASSAPPRIPLRCQELRLLVVGRDRRGACLRRCLVVLPRITELSSDRTRGSTSRGSTRLHDAAVGPRRALVPR